MFHFQAKVKLYGESLGWFDVKAPQRLVAMMVEKFAALVTITLVLVTITQHPASQKLQTFTKLFVKCHMMGEFCVLGEINGII